MYVIAYLVDKERIKWLLITRKNTRNFICRRTSLCKKRRYARLYKSTQSKGNFLLFIDKKNITCYYHFKAYTIFYISENISFYFKSVKLYAFKIHYQRDILTKQGGSQKRSVPPGRKEELWVKRM